MDSKEIAMEALTLASVQHNYLYKYSSDASYTKPPSRGTKSVLDLLIKIAKDKRFDDLSKDIDFGNMEEMMTTHQDLILEYWNELEFSDPVKDFETCQKAAVLLFITSVNPESHDYNFFIVHLLTSNYAVRVLLPFFPVQYHISLVRQWWLLAIVVFVLKGRPCPRPEVMNNEVKGRDWKYMEDKALNSAFRDDAHYVKGTSFAVWVRHVKISR